MKTLNETKLWIVINEETLNTMKGKGGKTAKFKTKEEADWKAAGKLNLWTCIKIHFEHKFINHKI